MTRIYVWNVTNPPRAIEKSRQNIQVITIKKSSLPSVSTSSDDCHTPQSMPHATINAGGKQQYNSGETEKEAEGTERGRDRTRDKDRETGRNRKRQKKGQRQTDRQPARGRQPISRTHRVILSLDSW